MSDSLISSNISSGIRSFFSGGSLKRMVPEPRSRLSSTFGSLLKKAGEVVSGSSVVSIDPEYRDLIETQIEFQKQMQLVSLHSNIEKSRHESKMAAIRNIRTN